MSERIKSVFKQFKVDGQIESIHPIEIGHINETYQIHTAQLGKKQDFVLQKINTSVFKKPQEVMSNILNVGLHLQKKQYPREVLLPVESIDSQCFVGKEGSSWRLFPFIKNTRTYNIVDTTEKAYQAAFTFGEYAAYLNDFEVEKLYYTIPDFHNTPLRFQQFTDAVKVATIKRLNQARECIAFLQSYKFILKKLEGLNLPLRVVHYDTKINNILFDKITNQPVCVIDLDTLMPGYLMYDYGDMVRTCTPNLDENSKDLEQLVVRKEILMAIKEGYLTGIKNSISDLEKQHLDIGAQLIIYEQALRFLTDFLRGNIYYKVNFENQNLVRAKNQIHLLNLVLKL